MTARIQPNTNPDTKAAEFLADAQKSLGMVPNLFTTLAHSTPALEYYMNGVAALSKTKISGALREQLALVTAGANNCDYCASAHTVLGEMQKIDKAELAQNLAGKSSDAKTQSALTFARKVIDTHGQISDSDLSAIKSAGFTDGEIIEIVAVVSENIFTNYINNIAHTDIDFPMVSAQSTAKAA